MRKKRAKGFYTLSSKASADQRVLVVLFNGYVTFFFAYEILGPGTMKAVQSSTVPQISCSALSDFRQDTISLCLYLSIAVNQYHTTAVIVHRK